MKLNFLHEGHWQTIHAGYEDPLSRDKPDTSKRKMSFLLDPSDMPASPIVTGKPKKKKKKLSSESRETFQPGPCDICGDTVDKYEDSSGLDDFGGKIIHGRCALERESRKRRDADLAKYKEAMLKKYE